MIGQVLIAVDQLINTLCGGFADETLSARLYRNRNRSGWWAFWYETVNATFFDPNHCFESWISECKRKQLPPSYRDYV